MAYRLYNDDVAEGITDFNDDHYHIIKEHGDTALVFDSNRETFSVMSGIGYEVLDSISYDECCECTDITQAMELYETLSGDRSFTITINERGRTYG